MPIEQRYTPVPGMGPTRNSNSHEMTQVGGSSEGYRGSYRDDDYLYQEGTIPAAHRFSYTDNPSRPTSQLYSDNMPGPSRESSYQNPFETPGLAAGTGAGVGAGAAGAYSSSGAPQMSQAYQNIPSENYWPESSSAPPVNYAAQEAKARRNRLWKWGGIIFGVLAVIAIVVGVVVSQVTKKNGGSSSSSDDQTSTSTNGTTSTLNGDPSQFTKDSRLHQSFWAIAYTPEGAILPNCNVQQANVTRDIQLLSQLTTRLRLYGANCNATAAVLQAIQDTKVDMTIWPAIYIDSNTQAYTDQVAAVKSAIETYGTDHMEGIIVGNEYILNTATTASTTDATYRAAAKTIMDYVQEVNTTILGMDLSKHLPIGTSDAGSLMSAYLGEGIDFFMANVHPWFGDVTIDDAAVWTYNFFQEFDVEVAAQASNNPACYIAETGWPSGTSNATEGNNGAASPGGDASIANLQTFMDTFVCQANKNGTEYFFFEAFDEPWKEIYGGVEPHWGIFDSDRNLKDITIPTC